MFQLQFYCLTEKLTLIIVFCFDRQIEPQSLTDVRKKINKSVDFVLIFQKVLLSFWEIWPSHHKSVCMCVWTLVAASFTSSTPEWINVHACYQHQHWDISDAVFDSQAKRLTGGPHLPRFKMERGCDLSELQLSSSSSLLWPWTPVSLLVIPGVYLRVMWVKFRFEVDLVDCQTQQIMFRHARQPSFRACLQQAGNSKWLFFVHSVVISVHCGSEIAFFVAQPALSSSFQSCVCVCVCVCERERETERETSRVTKTLFYHFRIMSVAFRDCPLVVGLTTLKVEYTSPWLLCVCECSVEIAGFSKSQINWEICLKTPHSGVPPWAIATVIKKSVSFFFYIVIYLCWKWLLQ